MKVYWVGVLFLGCILSTGAATLYVDVNATTHLSPYTNWATAAATIQDAVDVSVDGDEVVVANGVYSKGGRVIYGAMTNRVAIDRAITVRSVDGPAITLINGGLGDTNGGIRCAYLTNGAALVGFTLTNGITRTAGDFLLEQNGGAVWCASTSAVVSDCVLVGNHAETYAGAAYGGTLNNCTILRNSCHWDVGGAYSNTLNHCTLSDNQGFEAGGAEYSILNGCTVSDNQGGGTGGAEYSILNRCTLSSNDSDFSGGVAYCLLNDCFLSGNTGFSPFFNGEIFTGIGGGASYSTLNNCVLSGNFALFGGGAYYCSLYNCVLINNTASFYGGGAAGGVLDNCTVVGNSSGLGGGMDGSYATNSILYFNTATTNGPNYSYSALTYCCTFPQPASGFGNITNQPLFVNYAGGNLRLQSNSPCIDAGDNAAVVPGLPDLDGNRRIINGVVDIGAFEFQSGEFIAWLGQYGLPTDGSADHVDSDGDGMDNWQEWVAGTNPTNSLSVLKMLTASPGPAGITVSWQSVTNRSYFLERSSGLEVQFPFQVLVSNIAGQAGSTTFIDTNAPSSSSAFYRVGVSR